MKLKTLLLASTVALLAATGAKAADAIIAEEAVMIVEARAFSWTGAYIGGQIGYGWGKSSFSDADGWGSLKPDGFLGGVYAGYNFDVGSNFILGIDGDITYNNLKDSYSEFDPADGITTSLDSRLRWSGAVRARAGVAFDRFMPYIAGGVAFGSVKNSISLSDGVITVGDSQSKTHTGWTIGGGVDYAATDNVILRLEYRYTDYGRKDFSGGFDGFEYESRNKFKTNEIRLGVAYKF